ncbi:MAG: pyrroline-5-carboxylate reductase [Alphaproteobacteria bacterium]|nr:pyrroline-5-carboxylate reductase [Alphaproteobacteria bacterium]MBU0796501.1 pyrroline-5-carboxylate reductase [Alphaproteobacteria bacterium]MBU0888085.1 pyrroline-5-carboxylate reductase [Alphaproteobacteria bacterium]MBU1811530.1 pyrroline-5-carboxylate reductase [Alphaproteobacteria bacterium]MBU2091592.1 pyrroline-5-carboxylate reductase [Alphaproteobacteria bacterium]
MERPLLLVGCGKMGGALLEGWLKSGIISGGAYAIDPSDSLPYGLSDKAGFHHVKDADALPADLHPQVIVLAVKPQAMDAVIGAYRRFARPGTLFVSVAAGKTIGYFETHLGEEAAIVRTIPNTPAAIGRGITGCTANPNVAEAERALADALLQAAGEVIWVGDEALIDSVTGLAGSGPAYVFHMVEAMAAAGEKVGLPADVAMQLARATVAGAGELMRVTGEDAGVLRQNVTSPNGTTYAGLQVLMDPESGLPPLMARTVAAATKRSQELAG